MSGVMSGVILVTGGASGIGLAIARRFAAAGEKLVLADLNDHAGEAAAKELSADYRHLDVADETSVESTVSAIESDIGPIAVLINSAGLLQNKATIGEFPLDEHDRIWAVNYRGSYLMCRAIAPRMAGRDGGAILNIASINSFTPLPLPAYTPTKAAIESLTRLLAAEFGPGGVRVNAVAPGFTLTPAMQSRIDSGDRDPKGMEALSTLGRLVKPEEVAEAGYFLCSEAAAAITGVNLAVDCGYMAAISYNSYPS
ncbi:MAG: SDR family oxidoreductase [Rhodospirillaceae bacterium]|jgi:NAD(P)-dependent dehydrogenase (short-subunit alcohol dehydrogenase family)|nr:SDR family oxidoreductase [Rhodospirillaceae bacterium]MBT5193281.1 SDR family oxidoreductase [Rhodospirillaceae bacterium]MBT5896985.1 SDR family oxidoreductase [Rhodospirillaceae bacterium]MBT6429702.1 SDR family oxidoreductase [Rhodospirillaceae bacterium]MBT7759988.1 SDR family oxidoreductase [Rhodospirillaceae bacterium]